MKYQTTTRAPSRVRADCLIIGVFEGRKPGSAAADVDAATGGWLGRQLKSADLSRASGEWALVPAPDGLAARRLLVVGLGKRSAYTASAFRKAMTAAGAALRKRKVKSLAVGLTLEEAQDMGAYLGGRHAAELLAASRYTYDETKSKREKLPAALTSVTLIVPRRADEEPTAQGARHGQALANGISLARDLGNLPPNVCTPTHLADSARELARRYKSISTTVLTEKDCQQLGMGAFLSVTGGAVQPAQFIVAQYRGNGDARPVALIGKGITFDAGGISLKPPPGMDEMKFDMCGAASVLGTLSVVAALRLPINLAVVVPACENLPSGTATRPGDVVTSMSGKTIEILNTDAEGRLILCDAITYARKFNPDTVIDVATLTGACVIALGHHRTAVMSNSDALRDALVEAGIAAEDRAWPMPMADEYAASLKSNFADFANVGGREGGAITAACFLAKFADGLNWAHMDIAGTAWTSGAKKGATGRPVALLTHYLLGRAGALPGQGQGQD